MADDTLDKTEDPTPKKLDEARKKGIVARSQDLTISIVTLFTMIILFFVSEHMYIGLTQLLTTLFNHLNYDISDPAVVAYWLNIGANQFLWLLFPILFGVVCIAIFVNVSQTGLLISGYPLVPKWNRINIFHAANYREHFSSRTLVKLAFGLLRLNLVVVFSWIIIGSKMFQIYNLPKGTAFDIVVFIYREAILLGTVISIWYVLVGVFDFFYQRWSFLKEMKMSRREVRDEHRQMEGDLTVKERIQYLMQSFAGKSSEKLIAQADALIVDSSRYVIGLCYDPKKMYAPVCLFKGFGKNAKKMIEIGKKYHIPIVQNSILSQALYRTVPVNIPISKEYYYEVAKVMRQATASANAASFG